MPLALGVAAALPAEARLLVRAPPTDCAPVRLHPGLLLLVCGVGPERASAGARALLAGGAQALVSFGFAAGVAPALTPGTLVAPDRVLGAQGEVHVIDRALRTQLCAGVPGRACTDGVLAETEQPLWDCAAKAGLHARLGAAAADMESAALARAAAAAGVPFVAMRVVIDPASRDIPHCVRRALANDGTLRAGALASAVLQRPWELWSLLRLGLDFRAARASLGAVATALRAGAGTAQ